jgi:hypothetical protein
MANSNAQEGVVDGEKVALRSLEWFIITLTDPVRGLLIHSTEETASR